MISLYVCVGFQLQTDCKTVHISVVVVCDTVARINASDDSSEDDPETVIVISLNKNF